MNEDISSRFAVGFPIALSIGAVAFFLAGPRAVHALFDYGFGWDTSAMQDFAFLLGGLMSFPTTLLVDSEVPPRALLAINGAIWGGLLYSVWMLMVFLTSRMRRS